MKKCKYCQTDIDVNAKICPNCKRKQGKSKLWIIIVIISIFAIGVAVGSEEDAVEEINTEKTEKYTYKITDEYNDSFTHYIEGTVTNNRSTDYSYLQIEFICYDKEGNNLGTAIDNTNNLLGKQTWKFKAMGLFIDSKADHCDFHAITGW